MKSICNIFSPIDKTNGNFLLFSQYVGDVSRSVIDSNWRVRPSKFVCMDFDETIQTKARDLTLLLEGGDVTNYIPAYFQNIFENGISALKNENISISPFNFSIGFIDKLAELTTTGSAVNLSINLQNYVKYIGNIDLESWEDGFADIVLDINSGAKPVTATLAEYIGETAVPTNYFQFSGLCCGYYMYENEHSDQDNKYYIQGWKNKNDIPIKGVVSENGNIGAGVGDDWTNPWSTIVSPFDQLIQITESEDTSFTFNTIIIFYDIVDDNGGIIHAGVPMGIYFTGAGEADGIGSSITIQTSSETAYGAGSGWSLRICTKFSPTPYGNLQVEQVALESGSITKSLSTLLSATAEAIKAVNEFNINSVVGIQTLKELYGNFKNNKTNVPYPKEVGGLKYWFVNGRNTEVPCTVN